MHCRGYSLRLQRIITDFGSDVPFGQIPSKLHEHHGICVPVSEEAVDRRTTRQIGWQEARLVFARTPEQVHPVFGATFGSTDEAGEQRGASAIRVGVGQQTYVHGIR